MRNILLLVLILPVFFSHAMAIEIEDPASISKLVVEMEQSGTISAPGVLKWAKINLSIPQNYEHQKVSTDQDMITDALGNEIAYMYMENPGNNIEYRVKSRVETYETHTYDLPSKYFLPPSVQQFLEPTLNIQSNDYRIKELAENITKDAEDDFEKVALLAMWVHKNVEYDLKYGDKNYDAIWTLNSRTGVCAEYTTLFIALARAEGIPARYVTAYAHGENGWESHAYADVYLGKWVPVDALWFQIGNLDATHIRMTIQKDNQASNNVQVYGAKTSTPGWTDNEPSFEILDMEQAEKSKDYELHQSSGEADTPLYPGDKAVVFLSFTPKEYRVAGITLEPCRGDRIVEIEDKTKNIILKPGKEVVVSWKISIPENLKPNLIYTCPLTLNSRLLELHTIDFTIITSKDRRDKIALEASLGGSVINAGDVQNIYMDAVKNTGFSGKVGVIAENSFSEAEMNEKDKTIHSSLSFKPAGTGRQEVYVYTSTGDVKTLEFTVQEKGDIYIDKVEYPKALRINNDGFLKVHVRNDKGSPQTARISAIIDRETYMEILKVDKEAEASFRFFFDELGAKKISIKLEGGGSSYHVVKEVVAYTTPEVEVYLDDYDSKTAFFLLKQENDYAKNLTLEIAGRSETIPLLYGKKIISLKMPVGTYTANLGYQDLGGNEYSRAFQVEVKKPGLVKRIKKGISWLVERVKLEIGQIRGLL